MDCRKATGVEGVESVRVFPANAVLLFSLIYVTIYGCVYRSSERRTQRRK